MLRGHDIIPVVTVNSIDDGLRIAEQLLSKNIGIIEITLRTDAALGAIKAIKKENLPISVGAGTIVKVSDVEMAKNAGCDFVVSPGTSRTIYQSFKSSGLPYLPGVATATEIVRASHHGCQFLKLFPANIVGGIGALKAYNAVFPDVKFCPTGGVNADNYKEFLALDNVACVGGSWVVS